MKQKITSLALGLLVIASMFVALANRPAYAALLSSRAIKLSNSQPGATGVSYAASFTTSGSFQSLIIDFCNESPIIGSATCTAPTGMSVASSTVTFTSGTIGTVSTSGSSAGQLKVSGSAAQAAGSIAFTVANVTNPTTTGTFYARIYTYSNSSFGTPTAYSNAGSVGSTVDTGGVALSTAATLNLSATVQETLTFCVSGTSISTCSSATAPSFTLGSGSPVVLGTALSTSNIYTLTGTNALSGISIAMKNSNTCGGLSRDGGTTCSIAPIGATAATFAGSDGKFGMYIGTSTGQTGASITPASPYDQGGSSKYGMDNTTSGNNVTSTFGDQIASSTGPMSGALNTLTFGADTTPTTPAGVYTANMILIATGTF